jgi:peptidyl-prolyl cis-trans isomerase SurA
MASPAAKSAHHTAMSLTVPRRSSFVSGLCGLAWTVFALLSPQAAAATESRGVLAVVNDQPITSFDVEQRMKLTSILGSGKKLTRKQALELLINDILKRSETTRLKATMTEEQVDAAIERLAQGSGTTVDGLTAKLKTVGISMKALRTQIMTNMSFNRVLIAKYKIKPQVDDADVDKKLASIKQDPRMQPILVYELREIVLPIDFQDPYVNQLLQNRGLEARQIQQNYKGCGRLDDAVSGIFNVNVSKLVQVEGDKLPQKMREVLEKSGTSSLVGPMRAKDGIQLLAFCGKRTISPPGPTREQVQRLLVEQVYDVYEEKYLRDLRRTALIDYKDPSLHEGQTQ